MSATTSGVPDVEICQPQPFPAYNAKLALAAVRHKGTIAKLATLIEVLNAQIAAWKDHLLAEASVRVQQGPVKPPVASTTLHATIGELALGSGPVEQAPGKAGRPSTNR